MDVRYSTISYYEVKDLYTAEEFFSLRYEFKNRTINESYNSSLSENIKIIKSIKLFNNYKHTEKLINNIINKKHIDFDIFNSMNIFSKYPKELKKKIIKNLDINDVVYLTENTENSSNLEILLCIEKLIFKNISSRKLRNF